MQHPIENPSSLANWLLVVRRIGVRRTILFVVVASALILPVVPLQPPGLATLGWTIAWLIAINALAERLKDAADTEADNSDDR